MKSKHTILIALFFIATLLVLSWLFLCSYENFLIALNLGIDRGTILKLPEFFRPWYDGHPTAITLLSYILYTFTAFLLVKEKKMPLKIISFVSFGMLFWLLFNLF